MSPYTKSNMKRVAWNLVAAGSMFAILQWTFNRSLWVDEARIALNVLERAPLQLLLPLDHSQSAPAGYLLLAKLFSCLTPGDPAIGMRAVSLISFILALAFFAKACIRLAKSAWCGATAIALFAFSHALLYFSSELKQYMTDVLVATLLIHLALREYKTHRRKLISLAVAGFIAVFFSNAAPPLLAGIGLYLLLGEHDSAPDGAPRKKCGLAQRITPLAPVAIAWIAACAIYAIAFFDSANLAGMLDYWSNTQHAFMLREGSLKANIIAFCRIASASMAIYFSYLPHIILIPVAALGGCVLLMRGRRWQHLALLLAPIACHFILSALKLYPFGLRFMLYSTPLILLMALEAFNALFERCGDNAWRKFKWCSLMILLALSNACLSLHDMPIRRHEIRETLKIVSRAIYSHPELDADIHIDRFAFHSYKYYAALGEFPIIEKRIHDKDPETGEPVCAPLCFEDAGKCDEQGRLLHGKRWFITAMDKNLNIVPDWAINRPVFMLNGRLDRARSAQGALPNGRDERLVRHMRDVHRGKLVIAARSIGASAYLFDFDAEPQAEPQQ